MFTFKFSKIMHDVHWSFISLATISLSHLLLRIMLGQELGPAGLGVYTLAFTIYLFGVQFAGFGIGSALTKYVAEFNDENHKIKDYISAGISGSIISGLLMTVVLYYIADFIAITIFHVPEMSEFLKVISFCLPFIAIQKMVLGTLNGLRKMKLYALLNIIHSIFILISSIYLVLFLNTGVKGAIFGFVIPTIIIGLISIIFIKNFCSLPSFSVIEIFKNILWFGFYAVLANSIGMINTQLDSLMIGYFLDTVNLGYYAVATIMVQGVILIPISVHAAVAPPIAYYYGKGEYERIIKIIKSTMLKVFIVTVLISLFIFLFGKILILLLFSNEFMFAYYPLLILLIGYSIYAPVHSVDCTLLSIGKVDIMYKLTLICAFCNFILNIIFIPTYGILGASLATTLSIITYAILKLYFINKYVLSFKKKEIENFPTLTLID